MARFTRKELKKDPFLSVYYDDFVEFAQRHYQNIIVAVLVIIVVVIAGISWKRYHAQQEVAANTLLGAALTTFHAYVGQPAQGALAPGAETFADPAAKYQAAIKQFTELQQKYPHQEAGQIALYHIGLCQAQLGQQDAAIKTLQRAEQSSDRDLASLAQFALAGELAKTGKLAEAEAILHGLAERPTDTVPAPTAWLALAGAEREANPAGSREIYERVLKSFGSDSELVEAVKQQMAGLNP